MDNDNVVVQWNREQIEANGYVVAVKILNKAVFEAIIGLDLESMENKMTPKEELFAKFFSQAITKATDLSMEGLVSWIDELEEIIFEAKALAAGAEKVKKERVSKLRSEERDKLVSRPDIGVSDAINTVNKRKDRMSKIDKMILGFRDMGLTEDKIKELVGNVSINEDTQPAKTNLITFNAKNPNKIDVDKVLEDAGKEIKSTGTSDAKPFDPSSLF